MLRKFENSTACLLFVNAIFCTDCFVCVPCALASVVGVGVWVSLSEYFGMPDFFGWVLLGVCFLSRGFSMESLILAQDERWRRA